MAAGEIVKNAKVPAVGCSPTNPAVTKDNDFYFRVCFIDPFQGTVMANFAINELGAKTAAIIKDTQQDYSVGLIKFFMDRFQESTAPTPSSLKLPTRPVTGTSPRSSTTSAANPTSSSARVTTVKAP